jgi:uncharacterized protein
MRDGVAVDSVAFARAADELRATLAITDLARLHDALFDQTGEITYRLTGAVSKDGISTLRLEIAADLVLVCQRCLGPVQHSLKATRDFELVPENQPLGDPADEPGDVERIHEDAKLDVAALVEEETILCLPMVAVHRSGECSVSAESFGEKEAKSPFSLLSALKRQ